MVIIVRSIAPIHVTVARSIRLWNIETGEGLWGSGSEMVLTQKTNKIRGHCYYIPQDRADKGELLGFCGTDIFVPENDVRDTQFDVSSRDRQIHEMQSEIRKLEGEIASRDKIIKQMEKAHNNENENQQTLATDSKASSPDATLTEDALEAVSSMELLRIIIRRWTHW